MYCPSCGEEYAESQNFCKKCGNRLQNVYASNIYQQNAAGIRQWQGTPEISKPVRASGFLLVWLIIIIIVNVCLLFYYIYNAIEYSYIAIYLLEAILYELGIIAGAGLLLACRKIGFYILCISVFLNAVIYYIVYGYLASSVIGSIIFPILIWLAAKKQWDNFR